MKEKKLKVALVQQKAGKDKEDCLAISEKHIREAVKQGAQLVLLQELHAGRYFCQSEDFKQFDLAESIPGPTINKISALAKELKIVIVASVFERRAAGVYHNTAVVLESDGSIAGKYRKMHIPDDPGYYEKFYFTPGDLGFMPIQTSVGKLGVLVCWDQWYPEAARLMATAGAEILLYPTAIGWSTTEAEDESVRQREAWITVQRSHAIANGLPVITANRTGLETGQQPNGIGINFWGSSFILGPQGEFLAQAGTDEEEVLVVELNMTKSESVRRAWPFLRDRRIDAYEGLLQRYLL